MLDPARKRDWESEKLYQKMKKRSLTGKKKRHINNCSEKAEVFPKCFQNTLMKNPSQHIQLMMMILSILIVAQKDIKNRLLKTGIDVLK